MHCANCGKEISAGQKFCAGCGAPAPNPTATVIISQQEAAQGCQKILRMESLAQPLMIRLNPGISDGTQLRINNAQLRDAQGNIHAQSLLLTVRVESTAPVKAKKKQKKKIGKWLGPLLCFALLAGAVAANWDRITALIPGLSDISQTDTRDAQETAQALIPYFEQRYFLQNLSDEDLLAFCDLYRSVADFEESCSFSTALDPDRLSDLVRLLEAECPELFQVDFDRSIQYTYNSATGEVISLQLSYRMTAEEYREQYADCQRAVKALARQAADLSEAEKEKFAFDYLALNCWYDTEADMSGTAFGALVEQKAKCDGIALAYKWILEEMGMQCLCIGADIPGQIIGHAWNKVRVDGEYYNVDVTQSVRQDDWQINLEDRIIYAVYNVSDPWMEENYIIFPFYEELADLPACRSMENSYYVREGGYVADGEDGWSVLSDGLQTMLDSGGTMTVVQFESRDAFSDFYDSLSDPLSQWYTDHQGALSSVRYGRIGDHVCYVVVTY